MKRVETNFELDGRSASHLFSLLIPVLPACRGPTGKVRKGQVLTNCGRAKLDEEWEELGQQINHDNGNSTLLSTLAASPMSTAVVCSVIPLVCRMQQANCVRNVGLSL